MYNVCFPFPPISLIPKRYMKYLYPYECEKKNLSSPAELQAAIDGNRREGRRTSYGQFDTQIQQQLQMVRQLQEIYIIHFYAQKYLLTFSASNAALTNSQQSLANVSIVAGDARQSASESSHGCTTSRLSAALSAGHRKTNDGVLFDDESTERHETWVN